MNATETELVKLQQSIRESRTAISRQYSGLISDLDIQKRFTESVRHYPLRWVSGAAAAGLIATIFGGRGGSQASQGTSSKTSKKVTETIGTASVQTVGALSKAGWIAGALEVGKVLYPILRPLVVELATNAAKAGLAKRGRP